MNVLIMVDMEGISGICRSSQVMSDGAHYQQGRKYYTWDVNACVKGCFAGGAKKVVVRDAHSSGHHLIWEDLDERAEYIQGNSRMERLPLIDEMDAVILLGYHAMAGTPQAVLEHTMSSKTWQNCWINGKKSGELAIDGIIAGEHGVPVIMTSGDDKLCKEASETIKGIVTAEVKKGLDVEGAILLSKEKAHAVITQKAAEAVKNFKKIKPLKVKSPVTLRLEFVSRVPLPLTRPYVNIIDGRIFEIKAPSLEKAMRML